MSDTVTTEETGSRKPADKQRAEAESANPINALSDLAEKGDVEGLADAYARMCEHAQALGFNEPIGLDADFYLGLMSRAIRVVSRRSPAKLAMFALTQVLTVQCLLHERAKRHLEVQLVLYDRQKRVTYDPLPAEVQNEHLPRLDRIQRAIQESVKLLASSSRQFEMTASAAQERVRTHDYFRNDPRDNGVVGSEWLHGADSKPADYYETDASGTGS